jgi:hypothetical protein
MLLVASVIPCSEQPAWGKTLHICHIQYTVHHLLPGENIHPERLHQQGILSLWGNDGSVDKLKD